MRIVAKELILTGVMSTTKVWAAGRNEPAAAAEE
jgi:hypothetical protein